MLDAMPRDLRDRAFITCWTRKEAYVKAVGAGLAMSLKTFAVSVDPAAPARLLWEDGDRLKATRWTLTDLSTQPGYAGALVVYGRGFNHVWQTP